MTQVRRSALRLLAAGIATLALPGLAGATVITAVAEGTGSPPAATYPDVSVDGDFTYSGNAIATAVGDGNDESVNWTFDFTTDPDYPAFGGPIVSALLRLTLTPQNGLISTDIVRINGLANIITPIIQSLPVGVTSTIDLQLLDFYTSAGILGVLSGNAGTVPMLYSDDAILTRAELELATVPEPGTLALLGLGLVAFARRARRRG